MIQSNEINLKIKLLVLLKKIFIDRTAWEATKNFIPEQKITTGM